MNIDDPGRKGDGSPEHANKAYAGSEPNWQASPQTHGAMPETFSAAGGQNRVAKAGGVAAHHAGEKQDVAKVVGGAQSTKRAPVDEANIARLVAEENESRSKFPKYPGLERWELLEKMGDGAFSNVYRAHDREGNAGEVAIKVVRKFEMNNMQVSLVEDCRVNRVHRVLPRSLAGWTAFCFGFIPHRVSVKLCFSFLLFFPFFFVLLCLHFSSRFSTNRFFIHRARSIFIRTSRRSQRLQRCDIFLLLV